MLNGAGVKHISACQRTLFIEKGWHLSFDSRDAVTMICHVFGLMSSTDLLASNSGDAMTSNVISPGELSYLKLGYECNPNSIK